MNLIDKIFKKQENHVPAAQSVSQNNSNVASAPQQGEGYSLVDMIELTLQAVQCHYDQEEVDGELRYHFRYQGGNFVCIVHNKVVCRVVLPYCYGVPLQDELLAHRISTHFTFRSNLIKVWCGIVEGEEDEEDDVQFHVFFDLPLMQDVRAFASTFEELLSDCFSIRNDVDRSYREAKMDEKLETIDLEEARQAANGKK